MSQPIRILNIFMVLDRGGAETFVMNVYRKIDRTKVQFDFLVHGDRIGAYEEEIRSLGGQIFRLPKMTNFFAYEKAIKKFFDDHPRYTVIHSHACELGLFIFREAKRRGIPHRICHAHSAPRGFSVKMPIRYVFKKLMTKCSNEYMACSEAAGVWQFGKKKKFAIVKNGIDTDKFLFSEDTGNRIREELNLQGKFVVGHVGRFEPPKNHSFLVEVFEAVSRRTDAALLLIGDGSLRTKTEQEVKDKGLEDKVLFLGVQDNIAQYLCAMDAFVFPSLFEGLGIVLIEAQANGLKCYVSESIPQEAFVTDLVSQVNLSQAPSEWARIICGSDSLAREKYNKIVDLSGFNIRNTAEQLQKHYLSCL